MTLEFGQFVARSMAEAGIRGTGKLATLAGMSDSHVSRIVRGLREIGCEKAIVLMGVLNVPIERQVEFLLLAAGYSRELVDKVIGIQPAIKPLTGKEITLTLKLIPSGWRVTEVKD